MFCNNAKYLPVHEAETFMDERPVCAVRQVESVNLVHNLLDLFFRDMRDHREERDLRRGTEGG